MLRHKHPPCTVLWIRGAPDSGSGGEMQESAHPAIIKKTQKINLIRSFKMAIRNLRYEGDEILKKRAREIDTIDDKIKELANDMMDTMHKFDGVGLAAPQVVILKRLIVIDLYEEGTQYKLVNPVIVKEKGEQCVEEGCLSFPNKYGKVKVYDQKYSTFKASRNLRNRNLYVKEYLFLLKKEEK